MQKMQVETKVWTLTFPRRKDDVIGPPLNAKGEQNAVISESSQNSSQVIENLPQGNKINENLLK